MHNPISTYILFAYAFLFGGVMVFADEKALVLSSTASAKIPDGATALWLDREVACSSKKECSVLAATNRKITRIQIGSAGSSLSNDFMLPFDIDVSQVKAFENRASNVVVLVVSKPGSSSCHVLAIDYSAKRVIVAQEKFFGDCDVEWIDDREFAVLVRASSFDVNAVSSVKFMEIERGIAESKLLVRRSVVLNRAFEGMFLLEGKRICLIGHDLAIISVEDGEQRSPALSQDINCISAVRCGAFSGIGLRRVPLGADKNAPMLEYEVIQISVSSDDAVSISEPVTVGRLTSPRASIHADAANHKAIIRAKNDYLAFSCAAGGLRRVGRLPLSAEQQVLGSGFVENDDGTVEVFTIFLIEGMWEAQFFRFP